MGVYKVNTIYRVPDILEYIKDPLSAGLRDRSAYVRKTAVMGIVKVFYFAPEFVKGAQSRHTCYCKYKHTIEYVHNA